MSAAWIIVLCALMCPLGMALMMLFMRKGHGSNRASDRDEAHGRID
jgi:hypothetical protein